MYFMDLKLIAPLKRLNLIVETYPIWCKIKFNAFLKNFRLTSEKIVRNNVKQ